MSNVTYKATNHPVCASPMEFDITPVAPFWISEVLVYLNSSYPPPAAYGKIRAGTQAHPSHLTIFVDQAIYDQLCGCLGGSAVDISIDFDDTLTVTNVFGVAESLRALLTHLDAKVSDIAATLHAVKKDLERRVDRDSDISEITNKKTGSGK
jgi:hypothetical protein